MSGFIRRYTSFPGNEVLLQIEGVVIIDLPPPGNINGVGTGTVAMVGEFTDMGTCIAVDLTTGAMTFKPTPTQVNSSTDLVSNFGGFDSTIGDFGVSLGNAYALLKNKRFASLVCVAVNLCSGFGMRVVRQLPTNQGATTPLPIVPMNGGSVQAGTEFKSGANRVRSGTAVQFKNQDAYATGTDGSVTNAAPATTINFTSASALFKTGATPVQVGDLLVMGVLGAGGAQGSNALTYRVQAVTSDTVLVIEKLDGTSFALATSVVMVYRLHPAASGDSGLNHNFADNGGYPTPARPLDATITTSSVMSPTVAPPAGTATTWDPLSGLTAIATKQAAGIVFTSTIQAPNAASVAGIDALYDTAIDSLLTDDDPARDVNILITARTSAEIRSKKHSHCLLASTQGIGRIALNEPELSVQTVNAACANADPGVGGQRDERIIYTWPGCTNFVSEAIGIALKTADGRTTLSLPNSDGILDEFFSGFYASVLSLLAPERNPGQATDPIPLCLTPVKGYQRGVSGLKMSDFIQLKKAGVSALRISRGGKIIQSGVTSSLTLTKVSRRRMADFIEDSIAEALAEFEKQPATLDFQDATETEVVNFLESLLSPENPKAQRISAYSVVTDGSLLPQNIWIIKGQVQTTPTADVIVFQAEIGDTVVVTAQ